MSVCLSEQFSKICPAQEKDKRRLRHLAISSAVRCATMESSPPLLVVTLLFREKFGLGSQPHVVAATSAFLDSSVELPLANACKFGSLALLDRIWESSDRFAPESSELEVSPWCVRKLLHADTHYKQFQFTQSLLEAVRQQELPMVRWLFAHFPGFAVLYNVVEEATGIGSIEMLEYFRDHERNDDGDDLVGAVGEGRVILWGNNDAVLAARNRHTEVVRWLFEHTGEHQRYMPIVVKAAVGSGAVPLVEWLFGRNHNVGMNLRPELGIHDAAANGHVGMLQWLADLSNADQVAAGVLIKAAENGQLDVVRWIIDRDWAQEEEDRDSESDDDGYGGGYYGGHRDLYQCPAHITDVGGEASLAIHAAAVNGHLEIAKYLHSRVDTPLNRADRAKHEQARRKFEEKLPGRIDLFNEAQNISAQTMLLAAENGFLDVVRWLSDEFSVDPEIDLFYCGLREDWQHLGDTVVFDVAAKNGHLEVVRYLHELEAAIGEENERKRKRHDTSEAFDQADGLGVLESLYIDTNTRRCRRNGTLEMSTPPCTRGAMDGAAANNHLDVVEWLHDNRTEGCSTIAMDLAAQNGHLEMVQWLHHNRTEGCTTAAMDGAAGSGCLDLVKWLQENRTEGCTRDAMDNAARNGHLDIVKWLHEHRAEGCTKAAMDGAASSGSLDLVKWLHANRTEGCTTEAMDLAAKAGHLRVVQWLHENRSEGCTTAAMDDALLSGHFEVALFLHYARHEGCTRAAVGAAENDILAWVLRHYPAYAGVDEEGDE
ncbi:hypothetical protein BBJ28_00000462 [Nothophytophthora sp. Chile5]|nr:hypothetical protein BBJ28_00000462 [Nothophytophthora sp. Chile5]